MERIICLVLGYFFGCILTAELVTRRVTGKRAAQVGSGNPGTANIAASMGIGRGAIVLIGDILKTAVPCVLCRYVFFPNMAELAVLYSGVGVLLGHSYPFWNRFKGGMGVAVTCTYIVLASPVLGLAADATGLLAVLISGYLAVGALVIPIVYLIAISALYGGQAGVVAAAGTVVLIMRHLKPIKRIFNGTEKKTNLLGKLKRKK